MEETTKIYDRDGNLLYSIFDDENRKYVPLSSITDTAKQATIAIEDKNFYKHFGFDIVGMVRAQMKNLKDDKISQGASTITQQLAKNIFLTTERTYDRKIKELILSIEIELYYSKAEILEMYLNKIAYGSNAFGIEAASQTFFGKSSKDLSLLESAILASLPKAPTSFSPYAHKDELMGKCKSFHEREDQSSQQLDEDDLTDEVDVINQPVSKSTQETQGTELVANCTSPNDPNYVWGRKDIVLEKMVENGYITNEQMLSAWKEGLTFKFRDPLHKIDSPHFVFYVRELLEQKYGKEIVESGGLEVKTTLDPKLQAVAEEAVRERAEHNKKYYDANNAGAVALDPKTGQILAMVGSVNYWDASINGQVNTVTSLRQPGSSIKPLIYAAAIQNAGIGSGSTLSDYKTKFNKKDIPRNSDNAYKGAMTVRNALSQSRNIPAIKAFYLAGDEEKVLDFLGKIGLSGLRQFKEEFNKTATERGWTFNYGWPLAIGSGEVRLLDLANAYGALANQGKFIQATPILEVRNRKGELIESFTQNAGVQSIDAQAAYVVSNVISDVYARPAGSWRAALSIPGYTVAAKTGTSNKKVGRAIYPNNNLLMGYTPSVVVGVWIGNTDGHQMRGNAWAFADAGPIWQKIMKAFLQDKKDEPFPVPEGIKKVGREVYPSYMVKKDFDKGFVRVDNQTQQTNGSGTPVAQVSTGSKTQPSQPAQTTSIITPPNTSSTNNQTETKPIKHSGTDELPPTGF